MRKHLLYLTNNKLTATLWDKGVIAAGRTFENDEDGWYTFGEYLRGSHDVSAYLLTDLVEEDFQLETIPHVIGSARQNMIERRLANLYRDSPFRRATHQGRESEGRKDDRMLFSALTNPELLKPWLGALQKEKIAVAGVFSVALLSTTVFQKLKLGTTPVLLVTQQSSGLRQSLFVDGYLRFSRLTLQTSTDSQIIAETAASEIAKTRQFLASTRLMPRGAAFKVVVIVDAETTTHLEPLCVDAQGVTYGFIGLADAQQLLGLKEISDLRLSDHLFLGLLGRNRVASHYATFEQIRFHSLWRMRIALNMLSAIALAAGFIIAVGNGLDGLLAYKQNKMLETDILLSDLRYQDVVKSMPKTVANPHDMKSAVDLQEMIAENAPVPDRLVSLLSRALDAVPEIKLNELHWKVSETDNSVDTPTTLRVAADAPPAAALLGIPKKPFEILTIDAEIVPFQHDYRRAVESVKKLTDQLAKDKHIQVEVTKPPVDVRPTAKVTGQAGNDSIVNKAQFSLKLVWKP